MIVFAIDFLDIFDDPQTPVDRKQKASAERPKSLEVDIGVGCFER